MKTLTLSLALLMAGSAVASATIANTPPINLRYTVYKCPAPAALDASSWCPLEPSGPLP